MAMQRFIPTLPHSASNMSSTTNDRHLYYDRYEKQPLEENISELILATNVSEPIRYLQPKTKGPGHRNPLANAGYLL